MTDSKKVYIVGGRNYVQEPLVLGQWKQLLTTIKLPEGGAMTVQTITGMIGESIDSAIAIMVCEEGKSLKEKNIDELAEAIRYELDMDTSMQIVEDFFLLNDITSVMVKVGRIMDTISGQVTAVVKKEVPTG